MPNFEVDSIELATPELFSENEETSLPENHSGNEINSELFDDVFKVVLLNITFVLYR